MSRIHNRVAGSPPEQPAPDPVELVDQLGAHWSPDLDAYAAGELDASQIRCALCGYAPCQCPPFGTPEYFALIDKRHGTR